MGDRQAALLLQQAQALVLTQQYVLQRQPQQGPATPSSLLSSYSSISTSTSTSATMGATPPLSPFSPSSGGGGGGGGGGGSFKPHSKSVDVSSSSSSSGKDSSSRARGIVESHRKTEMCRNFPNCKYGTKCAFAHSKSELRRLSLEEMEHAGRIPNAHKYRVYPCLTWLSTGACPYNDRCVFIHDPRIKGSARAWLYATPGSSATRHSARSSPLYWPDLPTPTDDADALLSSPIEYEVVPRNPAKPSYHEASVYFIWQSYKAVMGHPAALGRDDDVGLGRALYGPGCEAPVRRLPVFERLSERHARQVKEGGVGYDEEAVAMQRFAAAHPPAMPHTPYLTSATAAAAAAVTGSSVASPSASYLLATPSSRAASSAPTTPAPSPFASPPLLPAGALTPLAATTITTTSTDTAASASASASSCSSLLTPPWGSEWRQQHEHQLQLHHIEPPTAAAAAAIASITSATGSSSTTTTKAGAEPQPQPQPQPQLRPSPLLSLLKALPTGSGALWPPSRPPSTPSSRAGTAPPSPLLAPLLTPQVAAAMAAAASMAASAGRSSPSLSSVDSNSSSGSGSGSGSGKKKKED